MPLFKKTVKQGAPEVEFLEFVVKQIVDHPEEITIVRTVDDLGILLSLHVSKEDMGKLIGKDGRTAKALRILLRVVGSKNNERVNMKIMEPEAEKKEEK